jgi:hypothetical protein
MMEREVAGAAPPPETRSSERPEMTPYIEIVPSWRRDNPLMYHCRKCDAWWERGEGYPPLGQGYVDSEGRVHCPGYGLVEQDPDGLPA